MFWQISKAVNATLRHLSGRGKVALGIFLSLQVTALIFDLGGIYLISRGFQNWLSDVNIELSERRNDLKNFFVLGSSLILGRSLILMIANLKVLKLLVREEASIAIDNFENWQAQPLSVRQTTDPSLLPIIVQETPNIRVQFILTKSISIFSETINLIFIFFVIGIFDPYTAVGSLIFYISIVCLQQQFISSRSSKIGQRRANALTNVYDFLDIAHRFTAIFEVMPSRSFKKKLRESRTVSAEALLETQTLQLLPRLTLDFSLFAGIVTAIGISYMYPVNQVDKSIGLFLLLSFRIIPILSSLQSQLSSILTFIPFLNFDLNHTPSKTNPSEEPRDMGTIPSFWIQSGAEAPQILLTDVGFHYPNSIDPALSQINLRLEKNLIYALVGPNGSGKSTLIHMLAGLIKPTEGAITFEGKSEYVTGFVPQTTDLFNGSIAQNIAIEWDAKFIDAKKIEQFNALFPQLLSNERDLFLRQASELSGGQKQVLCLFRALYREPNLLILDEANSAFDQETEVMFDQLLQHQKHNRITIVVSHRRRSIANADLIILMDSGSVIDTGSLAEISKRQPSFEKLISFPRQSQMP